MKILIIAATPFFSDRGCHMRILNSAKYLKKFGAKVKICTYFSGDDVAGLDVERIRKVGWYKRTAPGFSWGKFWLDVKLIFLCRRAIRKFRPDAVYAHMYEGLGVGYVAKRMAFRSVPIIIDLQADLDEEFRNYNRNEKFARLFFVWLSRRFVNRCDWVVVSSENVLPYIEKRYRHKDRISVIRDGIDLDLFADISELDEREQKEIDEIKKWQGGEKLLVYIGGLSDNKGVGDLLKSFLRLNLKNTGWKLLIGGFGKDEEKYKKFVEENGLNGVVYFAGRVRYFALPAYLALADAAIDPKNGSTEGSGKLVNLMTAGLPIVCLENGFNRARLGEKGLYLKNMDDLGNILADFSPSGKMSYDLESLSEEGEVRKLFEIFQSVTKK